MVGAVGVERVWGGGSAAGWSSPGFKRGGGGVLRCGSEERARERGEWVSGVFEVPVRTLEESGGLCRGALHGDVAVAAVGEVLGAAGRVAREREGQREATGGGGGRPRRVGASARRRMAGMAGKASAAALSVASAASTRAERGRRG